MFYFMKGKIRLLNMYHSMLTKLMTMYRGKKG
jgi:hypothetical protein